MKDLSRIELSFYGRKDRLHQVTLKVDPKVWDDAKVGDSVVVKVVEVQRIQVTS